MKDNLLKNRKVPLLSDNQLSCGLNQVAWNTEQGNLYETVI